MNGTSNKGLLRVHDQEQRMERDKFSCLTCIGLLTRNSELL